MSTPSLPAALPPALLHPAQVASGGSASCKYYTFFRHYILYTYFSMLRIGALFRNFMKNGQYISTKITINCSCKISLIKSHVLITHAAKILHSHNRVPKCDVIKFSFLHFSIIMTIFQQNMMKNPHTESVTHQIWHKLVHGGPRYGRMNT